MSLVNRIKNYFFTDSGQKIVIDQSLSWFNRIFGYDFDYGQDSAKSARQAYGENPYFFNIVDRIAGIVASMPRVLIDTETGKPIENASREAQSLEALLMNPNTFEDSSSFYYRLAANLLMGNLYVYKELPAGFQRGLPSLLMSPISTDVSIQEGTNGDFAPQSYSFTYQNATFNQVDPSQILHLKRPNILISTDYGFSTTHPTAPLWATSNEIFKSGYSLHKNKGIQGVLHGKGGTIMTPQEQSQLQEYYNKNFGSNEHTGKVKISTSEVGYIPMGVNPADLQSVQMNLDLLRATCSIFGAPSQLFGDVAASTYSNMEQAERAFYMNSVLPIARRIDKALNYWLVGDVNYCYKVDENQMSIVQDLKTDLINNSISLYQAGIINLEEARLMVNEDYAEIPEDLQPNQTEAEDVQTEENETEEE
jgi:HK97 family phage portal protein